MTPFAVLRILDANTNRAREGARVLEDYVRFVLEDASLAGRIKLIRHDIVESLPPGLRVEAVRTRDAEEDVGRQGDLATEYDRASALDVALASASRLTEALRVLEEYLKTIDRDAARRIEGIRYRAYTLHQQVMARLTPDARFANARLYVLITASLCLGDWMSTARAVIEGGADVVQLREKQMPDRELIRRAKELSTICRERNTRFIMNDRPDIALLANADGVHVGQDDLPVSSVRRIVGPDAIVGVSTHSQEQVDSAAQQRLSYIAVGPMFESTTKPASQIPGPELLSYAASNCGVPRVAIGGITPENAPSLLEADPDVCLCVCQSVIGAKEPRKAIATLKQVMTATSTRSQEPA